MSAPENPGTTSFSHAVGADCAGVECLSGIPGSVGGTPVQNVGAYGQEVSETVESVEVFDCKDGQVRELCREACGFTYRSSIFNTTERGRFIILRVIYALVAGGSPSLKYADLKQRFAGRETAPDLRGNARGGSPDSRAQRDADYRGRSRLPQRRIVLQESGALRKTARGFGQPREG